MGIVRRLTDKVIHHCIQYPYLGDAIEIRMLTYLILESTSKGTKSELLRELYLHPSIRGCSRYRKFIIYGNSLTKPFNGTPMAT